MADRPGPAAQLVFHSSWDVRRSALLRVRVETTSSIAGRAGKSMQSGSGWRVIDAASVGLQRRVRRLGVLVLGLALSGCVGAGQIAGLSDGRRATVAVESVEGAPPAVAHRFV